MTFKILKEDLFFSEAEALGHGVNVKGVMGAGIAVIFKKKFPEMFEEYKKLCKDGVLLPGGCSLHFCNNKKIFNLAIKDHWKDFATYKSLYSSICKMKELAKENKISNIALPLVGGGLGGLKKEKILSIKKEIFEDSDINLSVYVL